MKCSTVLRGANIGASLKPGGGRTGAPRGTTQQEKQVDDDYLDFIIREATDPDARAWARAFKADALARRRLDDDEESGRHYGREDDDC